MVRSGFFFVIILILETTLLSNIAALADPVDAWKPEKPVEIIIMGAEGGGADKATQALIKIIVQHKLAPVAFTAVNKPANDGAEAFRHMKEKKGDNHTLMVTLNSFFTTPLRNPELGINIEEMAPIARMAEDTFLLWVHADRDDIKTLDDFVKAVRDAGSNKQQWIMGGTGENSEDSLLTDFLNALFEINMSYKSYEGGGEVAQELYNKKIDSTVNNPSEQQKYYQEGKTKPLVSFTSGRLKSFSSTPALEELGHSFEYLMQRSVVGAPGMSPEAQAYYSDLFKKVFDTPEWQMYRDQNGLQGEFLSGKELMDYWLKQRETHQIMTKVMSLLKG